MQHISAPALLGRMEWRAGVGDTNSASSRGGVQLGHRQWSKLSRVIKRTNVTPCVLEYNYIWKRQHIVSGCLNNSQFVSVYDNYSLQSLPLHPLLSFHARHMYFYVLVGAPAGTECGCRRRRQDRDFSLKLVQVFPKLRIFRHHFFLPLF